MDYSILVEKLIEEDYLKTPLIIEAFKKINRADFLPENLKDEAGINAPLPIGFGQTNSQPLTVAFMLELLQPEPGDKILDVGSGSGWTSALLAYCVSHSTGGQSSDKVGKIFAIERIPELCEFGKKNISKYNFIKRGRVKIICQDGSAGLKEEAPFDRILVSAGAQEIPEDLKNQLKIGGRLVLPLESSLWFIGKKSALAFEEKEFPGFAFVPLVKDKWQTK